MAKGQYRECKICGLILSIGDHPLSHLLLDHKQELFQVIGGLDPKIQDFIYDRYFNKE